MSGDVGPSTLVTKLSCLRAQKSAHLQEFSTLPPEEFGLDVFRD